MSTPDIVQDERRLGAGAERLWRTAAGRRAGRDRGQRRARVLGRWVRAFAFAYLTSFAWGLSLALGALFFVILQHLTRAGWSVVVRRLAEGVASTLPFSRSWSCPSWRSCPCSTTGRTATWWPRIRCCRPSSAYLNVPFFVVRLVVFFAVWVVADALLPGRSRQQDESGDPELSLLMQRRAAPAMIAFRPHPHLRLVRPPDVA